MATREPDRGSGEASYAPPHKPRRPPFGTPYLVTAPVACSSDAGRSPASRISGVLLAAAAAIFMFEEAHAGGVAIAASNGFGSDFHGTIWLPDRAVLHGLSPYPNPARGVLGVPAVYLPPIFFATSPLGWLSLHLATWVWFGCLLAAAAGILAVLGVRDPWCYAFFAASLPVVQALVLGNASILVALGAALAWRFRDRRLAGPLAVAATVTIKFWIWPLFVWLLIVRPASGVRAAIMFAALTMGAWAIIGFHGFRAYPSLIHNEGGHFGYAGSLFVAALIQLHLRFRIASATGILGSLVLLGLAWARRSSEIEVFSLALLASLVGTTVGWPHYLVVMALPIIILYPRISLVWSWFPAIWIATRLGPKPGQFGYWFLFCLLAVVPVVIVFASNRMRQAYGQLTVSR